MIFQRVKLKEITKIDKSKKYRKVSENLINLIDRSFDEENAENVAILFRAFWMVKYRTMNM